MFDNKFKKAKVVLKGKKAEDKQEEGYFICDVNQKIEGNGEMIINMLASALADMCFDEECINHGVTIKTIIKILNKCYDERKKENK